MLAVTTRNKLRGPRFFLPMVRAWLLVRRQLARTPGMLRYITGIASLTEFYTLTLWESKSAMFAFTASGGHRQMMWMFTRWSQSFWSMRWQPTTDEAGAWGSMRLVDEGIATEPQEIVNGLAWLARSQVAESLAPYIDTVGRPDKRDLDPTACGVEAVLARVVTPSPAVVTRLIRGMRPCRSAPGLLRFTVGVGPGECLLVTLWRCEAQNESKALMQSLVERFPTAWAMRLTAGDYEIGHWNGLRLRQMAASRAVAKHARQPDTVVINLA